MNHEKLPIMVNSLTPGKGFMLFNILKKNIQEYHLSVKQIGICKGYEHTTLAGNELKVSSGAIYSVTALITFDPEKIKLPAISHVSSCDKSFSTSFYHVSTCTFM